MGSGGAVILWASDVAKRGRATIANSLFYGNEAAGAAGALYVERHDLDIYHCTIVDNYANRITGGIYVATGTTHTRVYNSIFNNNKVAGLFSYGVNAEKDAVIRGLF